MEQSLIDKIIGNVLLSCEYTRNEQQSKRKAIELITRTNPYRLVEFENDIEFIKDMIKTYQDKSWITIFGGILENIQRILSNGKKSSEIGIDIELPNRNVYVGSKSGPHWANSDQRKSMGRNSKILVESKNCEVYVVCSYGKSQSNYEYYTQIAGQKGWEFLTGDKEMYQKVMIGLINNENHLKDLKNRVYCDLEKITVEYWKSKFYNENNFDYSKYLNFVSAY
jgi:hypothetical protein